MTRAGQKGKMPAVARPSYANAHETASCSLIKESSLENGNRTGTTKKNAKITPERRVSDRGMSRGDTAAYGNKRTPAAATSLPGVRVLRAFD